MSDVVLYSTNAFLLSLILIIGLGKVAGFIGLVDIPSSMKTHEGQVPMVGSAMFAAFVAVALLLQPQPPHLFDLVIGTTAIVAVGTIDDLFDLRALVKLVLQCICAAMMLWPHDLLIRDIGVGLSSGTALPDLLAIPVTIFAVVGLVNAMNMIDGLDGLAGGIALVALGWFAVAAVALQLPSELLLILILACVVLGFLVFNFRHPWRSRAAVFLGDAGSMFLGLSLAFIAIGLSQRAGTYLSPIAVLWIFALPTIDTLSLLIRRAISGKGALSSDREHLHDLLLKTGLSANATVLVMVGFSAVFGAAGFVGWYLGVSNNLMLAGLIGPLLLHSWFVLDGHKRRFVLVASRIPGAA